MISPRWRRVILGLGLIIAVTMLWTELLEDRLIPKRWGVVEEASIFRSGQLHPSLVKSTLMETQIDVIVNLNQWRPEKPAHVAERQAVKELQIQSERYPMLGDGTGDPENYVMALARLDQAVSDQQRVLVHCTAGAQRTGAVIGLYRTLLQGRTTGETLDEMEGYGFDREEDEAMLRFLDNNMRFVTRRLVELEVLSAVPDPLPKFLSK